ncbi:protein amalgam-like [Tigriopus californicus]|uniref:protein amalgam-like n=1 Tax=Tigriopus californicus TaxID=6832 RepID=UPI0027DA5B53|nr:protein amalgam-like [Tigriopus californicus]
MKIGMVRFRLRAVFGLFSLTFLCSPGSSYEFNGGFPASSGLVMDKPPKSAHELFHRPLPNIISRGETIRAAVGEKVTLPCEIKNLGTFVQVWQKGDDVLTAQSLMVTPDPRFHLVSKHNLQISSIRSQDAGDYTCKISMMGEPILITHTLEILVPPSIRPDPPDGNYVVKKGRRVELRCLASGNPDPTITWSRQNNLLPSGEKARVSKTLIIDSVDRHEAGTYVCEATNGVGNQRAQATIQLQVLYPPEIELETDRVHSGDNKEAHLTCLIHGNPTPKVRWYKNSMLLDPTDTIRMTSRANRYTLILNSIRSGMDFGNYSCVAENSLGTFKKHIEVHGRPTPAVFRSLPEAGGRESYLLTWTVDSYSPIEEYRLLYRQIQPYHQVSDDMLLQGGGDWTNVIIPGNPNSYSFNHRQSYEITNLKQDAEYECLVQARNMFGWSEASRIFHFFTGKRGPAIRDLEWKSNSESSLMRRSQRTLTIVIFHVSVLFLIHWL